MRIQTFILGFALILFPMAIFAGAGHDHGHSHAPVTQEQATTIASRYVAGMANDGKIDKSWQQVKAMKTEQKEFGGNMEWVVVYTNENAADVTQKSLYVFITLGGEILGANYTGK